MSQSEIHLASTFLHLFLVSFPSLLFLLSGFQHICNNPSCTQSFPSVNTKHYHYAFVLETLAFTIQNGIFALGSTTDTSCVSYHHYLFLKYHHLLHLSAPFGEENKGAEEPEKGKRDGYIEEKNIKRMEKSTRQKQHPSLWLRFFLWSVGETVYQKTVPGRMCTHHPGGDRRHVAQHGIELLSLQTRDLPTSCRKRSQLLMPSQNQPA